MLGKPSTAYFQAALDAVDADPERTWMVGDDVEADVGGAQALGMHGVLVRTGKYRDRMALERPSSSTRSRPAGRPSNARCSNPWPDLPEWLEGATRTRRGRIIDLIEIDRVAAALERYPRFRDRCFTEAEQAYCESRPNPAQHYAARFAGKEAVGKALGSACGSPGRRSRSSAGRSRVRLSAGRARGPATA